MAALTKLSPGTRVRLKVGMVTGYGRLIEPGVDGRVGKSAALRFPDGVLRIWVWWTKNNGAWAPIGSLVRLKETE